MLYVSNGILLSYEEIRLSHSHTEYTETKEETIQSPIQTKHEAYSIELGTKVTSG